MQLAAFFLAWHGIMPICVPLHLPDTLHVLSAIQPDLREDNLAAQP